VFNLAYAGNQEASYLTDELSRRAEDAAPAGWKPLAGQRLKTCPKADFTIIDATLCRIFCYSLLWEAVFRRRATWNVFGKRFVEPELTDIFLTRTEKLFLLPTGGNCFNQVRFFSWRAANLLPRIRIAIPSI
jgi:hypothetical protein